MVEGQVSMAGVQGNWFKKKKEGRTCLQRQRSAVKLKGTEDGADDAIKSIAVHFLWDGTRVTPAAAMEDG